MTAPPSPHRPVEEREGLGPESGGLQGLGRVGPQGEERGGIQGEESRGLHGQERGGLHGEERGGLQTSLMQRMTDALSRSLALSGVCSRGLSCL